MPAPAVAYVIAAARAVARVRPATPSFCFGCKKDQAKEDGSPCVIQTMVLMGERAEFVGIPKSI